MTAGPGKNNNNNKFTTNNIHYYEAAKLKLLAQPKKNPVQSIHKLKSAAVWQYGWSSFQGRDTKLDYWQQINKLQENYCIL